MDDFQRLAVGQTIERRDNRMVEEDVDALNKLSAGSLARGPSYKANFVIRFLSDCTILFGIVLASFDLPATMSSSSLRYLHRTVIACG